MPGPLILTAATDLQPDGAGYVPIDDNGTCGYLAVLHPDVQVDPALTVREKKLTLVAARARAAELINEAVADDNKVVIKFVKRTIVDLLNEQGRYLQTAGNTIHETENFLEKLSLSSGAEHRFTSDNLPDDAIAKFVAFNILDEQPKGGWPDDNLLRALGLCINRNVRFWEQSQAAAMDQIIFSPRDVIEDLSGEFDSCDLVNVAGNHFNLLHLSEAGEGRVVAHMAELAAEQTAEMARSQGAVQAAEAAQRQAEAEAQTQRQAQEAADLAAALAAPFPADDNGLADSDSDASSDVDDSAAELPPAPPLDPLAECDESQLELFAQTCIDVNISIGVVDSFLGQVKGEGYNFDLLQLLGEFVNDLLGLSVDDRVVSIKAPSGADFAVCAGQLVEHCFPGDPPNQDKLLTLLNDGMINGRDHPGVFRNCEAALTLRAALQLGDLGAGVVDSNRLTQSISQKFDSVEAGVQRAWSQVQVDFSAADAAEAEAQRQAREAEIAEQARLKAQAEIDARTRFEVAQRVHLEAQHQTELAAQGKAEEQAAQNLAGNDLDATLDVAAESMGEVDQARQRDAALRDLQRQQPTDPIERAVQAASERARRQQASLSVMDTQARQHAKDFPDGKRVDPGVAARASALNDMRALRDSGRRRRSGVVSSEAQPQRGAVRPGGPADSASAPRAHRGGPATRGAAAQPRTIPDHVTAFSVALGHVGECKARLKAVLSTQGDDGDRLVDRMFIATVYPYVGFRPDSGLSQVIQKSGGGSFGIENSPLFKGLEAVMPGESASVLSDLPGLCRAARAAQERLINAQCVKDGLKQRVKSASSPVRKKQTLDAGKRKAINTLNTNYGTRFRESLEDSARVRQAAAQSLPATERSPTDSPATATTRLAPPRRPPAAASDDRSITPQPSVGSHRPSTRPAALASASTRAPSARGTSGDGERELAKAKADADKQTRRFGRLGDLVSRRLGVTRDTTRGAEGHQLLTDEERKEAAAQRQPRSPVSSWLPRMLRSMGPAAGAAQALDDSQLSDDFDVDAELLAEWGALSESGEGAASRDDALGLDDSELDLNEREPEDVFSGGVDVLSQALAALREQGIYDAAADSDEEAELGQSLAGSQSSSADSSALLTPSPPPALGAVVSAGASGPSTPPVMDAADSGPSSSTLSSRGSISSPASAGSESGSSGDDSSTDSIVSSTRSSLSDAPPPASTPTPLTPAEWRRQNSVFRDIADQMCQPFYVDEEVLPDAGEAQSQRVRYEARRVEVVLGVEGALPTESAHDVPGDENGAVNLEAAVDLMFAGELQLRRPVPGVAPAFKPLTGIREALSDARAALHALQVLLRQFAPVIRTEDADFLLTDTLTKHLASIDALVENCQYLSEDEFQAQLKMFLNQWAVQDQDMYDLVNSLCADIAGPEKRSRLVAVLMDNADVNEVEAQGVCAALLDGVDSPLRLYGVELSKRLVNLQFLQHYFVEQCLLPAASGAPVAPRELKLRAADSHLGNFNISEIRQAVKNNAPGWRRLENARAAEARAAEARAVALFTPLGGRPVVGGPISDEPNVARVRREGQTYLNDTAGQPIISVDQSTGQPIISRNLPDVVGMFRKEDAAIQALQTHQQQMKAFLSAVGLDVDAMSAKQPRRFNQPLQRIFKAAHVLNGANGLDFTALQAQLAAVDVAQQPISRSVDALKRRVNRYFDQNKSAIKIFLMKKYDFPTSELEKRWEDCKATFDSMLEDHKVHVKTMVQSQQHVFLPWQVKTDGSEDQAIQKRLIEIELIKRDPALKAFAQKVSPRDPPTGDLVTGHTGYAFNGATDLLQPRPQGDAVWDAVRPEGTVAPLGRVDVAGNPSTAAHAGGDPAGGPNFADVQREFAGLNKAAKLLGDFIGHFTGDQQRPYPEVLQGVDDKFNDIKENLDQFVSIERLVKKMGDASPADRAHIEHQVQEMLQQIQGGVPAGTVGVLDAAAQQITVLKNLMQHDSAAGETHFRDLVKDTIRLDTEPPESDLSLNRRAAFILGDSPGAADPRLEGVLDNVMNEFKTRAERMNAVQIRYAFANVDPNQARAGVVTAVVPGPAVAMRRGHVLNQARLARVNLAGGDRYESTFLDDWTIEVIKTQYGNELTYRPKPDHVIARDVSTQEATALATLAHQPSERNPWKEVNAYRKLGIEAVESQQLFLERVAIHADDPALIIEMMSPVRDVFKALAKDLCLRVEDRQKFDLKTFGDLANVADKWAGVGLTAGSGVSAAEKLEAEFAKQNELMKRVLQLGGEKPANRQEIEHSERLRVGYYRAMQDKHPGLSRAELHVKVTEAFEDIQQTVKDHQRQIRYAVCGWDAADATHPHPHLVGKPGAISQMSLVKAAQRFAGSDAVTQNLASPVDLTKLTANQQAQRKAWAKKSLLDYNPVLPKMMQRANRMAAKVDIRYKPAQRVRDLQDANAKAKVADGADREPKGLKERRAALQAARARYRAMCQVLQVNVTGTQPGDVVFGNRSKKKHYHELKGLMNNVDIQLNQLDRMLDPKRRITGTDPRKIKADVDALDAEAGLKIAMDALTDFVADDTKVAKDLEYCFTDARPKPKMLRRYVSNHVRGIEGHSIPKADFLQAMFSPVESQLKDHADKFVAAQKESMCCNPDETPASRVAVMSGRAASIAAHKVIKVKLEKQLETLDRKTYASNQQSMWKRVKSVPGGVINKMTKERTASQIYRGVQGNEKSRTALRAKIQRQERRIELLSGNRYSHFGAAGARVARGESVRAVGQQREEIKSSPLAGG